MLRATAVTLPSTTHSLPVERPIRAAISPPLIGGLAVSVGAWPLPGWLL
jgi:hypothetical protein